MMDRILKPCESVVIDGRDYKINTDFSTWIEIGKLFMSKSENNAIIVAEILARAYPVLPENPIEAIEKVMWFFRCGEERKTSENIPLSAPVFDLEKDFAYIWASFLGEFGIDLSATSMHWWRFRALLSSLGENCRFSKIVAYRSMDTSLVKDRKRKRFYEKMKRKYQLPDNRTEREKEVETVLKMENLF